MTMRIDFAQFAIPRDAANDELREWINELYRMWADTFDLLAEYQEGEYVKVVRCRDCERFEPTAKNGICHRSEFLPMWAEPNGFCAWAERKEVTR